MEKEPRILKLPWKVYMKAAYEEMRRIYPTPKEPAMFMRKGGYEPDREVYDIPDYVEFELD